MAKKAEIIRYSALHDGGRYMDIPESKRKQYVEDQQIPWRMKAATALSAVNINPGASTPTLAAQFPLKFSKYMGIFQKYSSLPMYGNAYAYVIIDMWGNQYDVVLQGNIRYSALAQKLKSPSDIIETGTAHMRLPMVDRAAVDTIIQELIPLGAKASDTPIQLGDTSVGEGSGNTGGPRGNVEAIRQIYSALSSKLTKSGLYEKFKLIEDAIDAFLRPKRPYRVRKTSIADIGFNEAFKREAQLWHGQLTMTKASVEAFHEYGFTPNNLVSLSYGIPSDMYDALEGQSKENFYNIIVTKMAPIVSARFKASYPKPRTAEETESQKEETTEPKEGDEELRPSNLNSVKIRQVEYIFDKVTRGISFEADRVGSTTAYWNRVFQLFDDWGRYKEQYTIEPEKFKAEAVEALRRVGPSRQDISPNIEFFEKILNTEEGVFEDTQYNFPSNQ